MDREIETHRDLIHHEDGHAIPAATAEQGRAIARFIRETNRSAEKERALCRIDHGHEWSPATGKCQCGTRDIEYHLIGPLESRPICPAKRKASQI